MSEQTIPAEVKKIKITLTRRAPVQIIDSEWSFIASSEDKHFDNQYEFQANRISKWDLDVRQHDNGCAIVYGRYSYDSRWQGANCYNIRGGELLPAGADIVAAIERVGEWMHDQVQREKPDDAEVFLRLVNECTASLPAEDCGCPGLAAETK